MTGTAAFDEALVQRLRNPPDDQPPGRPIPKVPLAEHRNHTPFDSQCFQAVDQAGEVFHVVALKISFDMLRRASDGSLAHALRQPELCTQDAWSGEPNASTPLWESDYAPYKPRCDVLLANAFAPPGRGRWRCGLAVQWLDEDSEPAERLTFARHGEFDAAMPLAAFGCMPRTQPGRLALAGRYDDVWLSRQWPLPPEGFDFAYWNCAPAEQQMAPVAPGARIRLLNVHPAPGGGSPGWQLAPGAQWEGLLPADRPFVLWRLHTGPMLERPLLLDTVVVDMAALALRCTYRAVLSGRADVRAAETRLELLRHEG